MKAQMRRYLNKGNNLQCASEMKRALDSYGGVKSTHVVVATIDVSKQRTEQQKWAGLQAYSNFKYESNGLRVWKAHEIGSGKFFQ